MFFFINGALLNLEARLSGVCRLSHSIYPLTFHLRPLTKEPSEWIMKRSTLRSGFQRNETGVIKTLPYYTSVHLVSFYMCTHTDTHTLRKGNENEFITLSHCVCSPVFILLCSLACVSEQIRPTRTLTGQGSSRIGNNASIYIRLSSTSRTSQDADANYSCHLLQPALRSAMMDWTTHCNYCEQQHSYV